MYASEADILNVAMFGMTAAEWKFVNKDKKGNIRDSATMNQLICLANMENPNSVLITHGVSQEDRFPRYAVCAATLAYRLGAFRTALTPPDPAWSRISPKKKKESCGCGGHGQPGMDGMM